MPTGSDFIKAFSDATKDSSGEPIFKEMCAALGNRNVGTGIEIIPIRLNTKMPGSDSTVVENAVRIAFNDDINRARFPDAKFGEIPVEVKFTTSGFKKLPTDSYGLTNTTEKWYLFVKGRLLRRKNEPLNAWLMRSDHLYNHVTKILPVSNTAIIPGAPTAVSDIANEIHELELSLANIINNRAQGLPRSPADGTMSLSRKVGANRVRFDIKFETLLRKAIHGMLRD